MKVHFLIETKIKYLQLSEKNRIIVYIPKLMSLTARLKLFHQY